MKPLTPHAPHTGAPRDARDRVVIFGGAGFVGTNVADHFAAAGHDVVIFDSLARDGVRLNADWLERRHPRRIRLIHADIRDRIAVGAALRGGAARVFHFAAQVAVTTSLDDPRHDFEVNALGTFNILEGVRQHAPEARVLFTSTNKVYGDLPGLRLVEQETRYAPAPGIPEANTEGPLDFHSPYGCSKGAADQYVLDYGRTYGLATTVFRMSCIYGPHQHGNEDQGWVAHFLRRAMAGESVTLYGNGKQVRDILYVEDLVRAMDLATSTAEPLTARAFNIGGGVGHTISLLELCDMLREQHPGMPALRFGDERIGDQRYYVSDTSALTEATGWRPTTPPAEGLACLAAWVREMQAAAATPARPAFREPVNGSRRAAGLRAS